MSQDGESRRSRAARRSPDGLKSGAVRREAGGRSKGKALGRGGLARLGARGRVLRAVVIFAVLMGLFYGLIHNPYVGPEPFQPYLALIARTTGGILSAFGQDTTVVDTSVTSPEFSMAIVRGCDAIEPTAAFVSAVLASPVSVWAKIPGILVGTAALMVINLVRLVSLFYVGVYFPKALDFMHFDVWQAAFIVLAICFWAIWVQWATRGPPVEGERREGQRNGL